MKIGRVELTKEQQTLAVAGAGLIGILVISFIFYPPLMKQLTIKRAECRTANAELLSARNIIESPGEVGVKRTPLTEKDISYAIDELTKRGRLQGVDFLSISPGEIKEEAGSARKILPVVMKIKSTYEQLGGFLGSLDELERGLVNVKSFDIVPDKNDAAGLFTDMVVEIYTSE